jgi:hypothetical protein
VTQPDFSSAEGQGLTKLQELAAEDGEILACSQCVIIAAR